MTDLRHGECLSILREMDDNSVDSVVTDPPYALSFMSKDWDSQHPYPKIWKECLRVLKPGGYLLSFGGTRTWHRLCCDIEDAGFEIRDSIAWLYSQGFPKSMDISKAIDKAAGAERETIGRYQLPNGASWNLQSDVAQTAIGAVGLSSRASSLAVTAPSTDLAKRWDGWGTALKPAHEPIIVARKPFKGTVMNNVLERGTGAINVDACRVGNDSGRWPSNVLLDDAMAAELDNQVGTLTSGKVRPGGFVGDHKAEVYGKFARNEIREETVYGDSGGPSRFFPVFRYQAKAPSKERPSYLGEDGEKVGHNTVKPLGLMRWLTRLVTRPGGVVLDPFAGSGTTVEAALLEGFDVIAIEKEAEYIPLIKQRIARV